ncbi:MAG: sigma-54-dependent Fis family transcriptional regulator [Magnetococcales bacterium]|nr:sigma-54-dependent Fis family transcriptional regulator [Magnetococcales bacterium]
MDDTLTRDGIHGPLKHPESFARLIGRDASMLALFEHTEAIAHDTRPVLISGEPGVGKTMLAHSLHHLSRAPKPIISLQAAGLDHSLFFDALFGNRMAPDNASQGALAVVGGGTLLIRTINDLEGASQQHLLRLLKQSDQTSSSSENHDFRLVVTCDIELEQRMRQGRFLPALYERLTHHKLSVPPLRERRDDIPLLFEHFLHQAALCMGREIPDYPPSLLPLLDNFLFPHNVHELRSLVFKALAHHQPGGPLSLHGFRLHHVQTTDSSGHRPLLDPAEEGALIRFNPDQLPTLKECESLLIREAMRRANGNQGIAASLIGLSRTALNRRLKKLKRS